MPIQIANIPVQLCDVPGERTHQEGSTFQSVSGRSPEQSHTLCDMTMHSASSSRPYIAGGCSWKELHTAFLKMQLVIAAGYAMLPPLPMAVVSLNVRDPCWPSPINPSRKPGTAPRCNAILPPNYRLCQPKKLVHVLVHRPMPERPVGLQGSSTASSAAISTQSCCTIPKQNTNTKSWPEIILK